MPVKKEEKNTIKIKSVIIEDYDPISVSAIVLGSDDQLYIGSIFDDDPKLVWKKLFSEGDVINL